ncbi:hypothetical protein Pla110_44010 [Polystyrenella longa]|uniref:Uncharacterized protein n=1 Tax=Polystyrenella longa TaxID=2528007 RepID=A0A518CTT5_9PLAN|nr:hypothetical protein [Polystyrenella longa]QDU82640.1 hypothetical protein Pla110_44010 [Polystyrenella longa]
MAGNWIKVNCDLATTPEVLMMADQLDSDEDMIVGKLIRLWSWFDTHTEDGSCEKISVKFIDRHVRLEGFAKAMMEAGWLCENKGIVSLPSWEEHNGETAKRRAKDNKRKGQKSPASKKNPKSVQNDSENIPDERGNIAEEMKNRIEENRIDKNKEEKNKKPAAAPQRSSRQPDEYPPPTWEQVQQQLIDFGVQAVNPLVKQARESYTPAQAIAVIGYAQLHKFAPNLLYSRMINTPGKSPLEHGWPQSKKPTAFTEHRYAAQQRAQEASKAQADREEAEKKQKHQAQRERLEEQFGKQLDSMSEETRNDLLSKSHRHDLIKYMTPDIRRFNQLTALFELSKNQAAASR